MKPEILERQRGYRGYLTVERLRIRLSDGAEVWRDVEGHGDGVAVLPYDPDRRCVLLVRLFRAPVFDTTGAEWVEEACAGMIGHETAETALRREADEELGVRLGALHMVGQVWTSPGVSRERLTLFLAEYSLADRTGPGGGVPGEHEGIAVVEQSLAMFAADLDQGRIDDGKLLTLGLALRQRRPELFGP